MPIQAERRHRWDYGPGLWGCCFGGPWRRPSRREKTEVLKDYIADLKEELQDAEERLKDLEKQFIALTGALAFTPQCGVGAPLKCANAPPCSFIPFRR